MSSSPDRMKRRDAAAGTPPSLLPLQDPASKYPRPPFPEQHQPWPGLASRMQPRPDHGEDSYRGSGRLLGRRALITGGDSGMGRAAAIAFAREGADVAINYLPLEQPDADEVVALIEGAGRKAAPIPGDLREESFCRELVARAVKQLGGLDILVSNAGRQQANESILDISTEQFDWTMKTNIYAPFWIIKAALPHLKPGACIIATTSEQAYDPTPDLYDYAQTKAATMSFVKSLAKQLAPKGHPGQRRRAWADLDPAADQRRRVCREAEELRQSDTPRAARDAGGAGRHLRAACGQSRAASPRGRSTDRRAAAGQP
jgi:NAD(P)-dependent dehydrogenase (short-subunit alcohol dehydrogenase family)